MIAPAQVIAVDVGGTAIKAALIDIHGTRTHPVTRPTPAVRGGVQDAVIAAVLDTVTQMQATAPSAVAVGVVVPGMVDEKRGVAVYSENIGWHDIPFATLVRHATGLPAGFGHDVRAAGIVEHEYGAGAGVDEFLFMPIGTGISAAMFTGGELIRGELAGEIGHIDVGTGRLCACGAVGCLETIASARAITHDYNRRTHAAAHGAAEVAAAARSGDPVARDIWAQATTAIATVLTTYVTVLSPQCIAVGGGLAEAGEQLLTPVRAALDERLVWQQHPTITCSTFGDAAGQFGAALLAFRAAAGATPDFTPRTAHVTAVH